MQLSPYKPRAFLPETIDLGDWAAIEPLLDALEQRLNGPLVEWFESFGEFCSAIAQEGSIRYIRMTCQTDDPEREKAYLHFVEVIEPRLKPRIFRLQQKVIAHPDFATLPSEYDIFKRSVKNEVELYREENIPLKTEEQKLGQRFQKLTGAMTAEFEGREQTLIALGRYLEEPDREKRRTVFELIAHRRIQDREELDGIFDNLLKIRVKIAANAGFDNYRDYVFRAYERFDYAPEDCLAFHRSVEKHVVPLVAKIHDDRRRDMGLDQLRPWDLAVDSKNRPPLKPFSDAEDLIARTEKLFRDLDPTLGSQFSEMRRAELLDLANRKGKAPGGYQSTLQEARRPFIFMNAVGLHRDVETILHEAGHAFHVFAARDQFLREYRHAPIEFCEVASMGMELLASDLLGHFYSEADRRRALLERLRGILTGFPWIAQVDAFQHWIYLNPDHSREERTAEWLRLSDTFGAVADWSGYEWAREALWQRQLHIFEYPFYYIEYGIAQLGALMLWSNARRDLKKTIEEYRHALSLGGSKPLPELFAAAGVRFDFSDATIGPLIDDIREEYEKLNRS